MKLLFDQNLSWKVVKAVTKKFPESKHVISLGLDSASDKEIWDYAKINEYIIQTQYLLTVLLLSARFAIIHLAGFFPLMKN